MNSELWPVGTWVAERATNEIWSVTCHDERGMSLRKWGTNGHPLHITSSKVRFVEIPTRPDVQALKRQGYRLTGMAADCSKHICGEAMFAQYYPFDDKRAGVAPCGDAAEWHFNGWRWLVERIEEERLEDQLAKDAADDHFAEENTPATKPSSPWIDASERTPENDETRAGDREVLMRLVWPDGGKAAVLGYYSAKSGWCKSSGLLGLKDQYVDGYRIQWMDIPE